MERDGYRENLEMLMMLYPGRATLSVKEVAEITDSNIGTIYEATKRVKKPLPCKKIGGKLVISISTLARWLC